MVKTIMIGDKTYNLKSSAYTPFAYEDFTGGRKMLSDLKTLMSMANELKKYEIKKVVDGKEVIEYTDEGNLYVMENLQELVRLGLALAYVMIQEQDASQITSYEDWLKGMDNLFSNTNWIKEVIDCAMSTFQGQVQKSS